MSGCKQTTTALRAMLAATIVWVGFAPAGAQAVKPTPEVGTGPNYRAGAPFRAKLSPPFAEGTVLLVRGEVRDAQTGQPISGVVLDAYHADNNGDYDREGFDYRARILTDERGRFEFETIRPRSYGPAPHIHFLITADGYRTLRTQMLFRDERHPDNSRPELTPQLVERSVNGQTYLEGELDLTLLPTP